MASYLLDAVLELSVTVYNINLGYNTELMQGCKLLGEYARYVAMVRKYAKNLPFSDAVELAVNDCIQNGILADFLAKNRAEVIAMSIFEFNEEMHLKGEREFSWNEGHAAGRMEGIQIFILDHIEESIPKERTLKKLQKHFGLSAEDAGAYYDSCSKLYQTPPLIDD